jgi:hypothetical protein
VCHALGEGSDAHPHTRVRRLFAPYSSDVGAVAASVLDDEDSYTLVRM